MQLRNPFDYLQTYLDNNPEARETYVKWGLEAAKLAVVPINRLLRHLIEVQHLDLNAMPGMSALNSANLFKSGQMDSSAYDDDFDDERLAKIYEKIRSTPPPMPPEEFSKFIDDDTFGPDDSAFQLDPLDRIQNVLDLIDEEYKSVPNIFREAAENSRDSLSMEEIKKLMDRTEELKRVKEVVSKIHEVDASPHCVKPRPKRKTVKQAAKVSKKKPNKKPDFRGPFIRAPRR